MKVVYEKNILEKIEAEYYKAVGMNKTIKEILLNDQELRELHSYCHPTMRYSTFRDGVINGNFKTHGIKIGMIR